MSKERGIDISYWQGDIDFKKIKMNEDVKFVILREGYRQTMDKQFLNYVFGCRTWGIPIHGVYHFIYMMNDRVTSNAETGRLNAESCLRNIQNAQLRKDEIIVWCDLEYDTLTHAKRTHNIDLTSQDIREITTAFCNEILKSGYRVGIYTNLDYARNRYGLDFLKNFDIWLADYNGSADLPCLYHQYTSDGQVSGIQGKVDMNWKMDTTDKEESQMGVSVQNVLNVARSWIGRNEGDGSHKYIIDLYNSVKPLPRGYMVKYTDHWCSTFVSAVAIKAGATDIIPRECGCEKQIELCQKMGIWIEDGTITPRAGDIIFYNWDDNSQPNDGYADHVGIVESVGGYTITVIEGNMSERVGRRNIRVGHGNIRGYARPRYSNSGSTTPVQPSKPAQKDITTIAKEVVQGLWGNGEDRKQRLQSAGYDYQAVQNEVNRITGASSVDINKIAHDVIRGAYGNGNARRNALVQKYGASVADAVQRRVNQLL